MYIKNLKFIMFLVLTILAFSLILGFIFTASYADDSIYVWSDMSKNTSSNISNNSIPTTNLLQLESTSAVLIEQSTGQILYSHNMNEKLRPASVTKVMTVLLIMEAIDSGKISLTDIVPCSENAAAMGGSQIWLDPQETLTVDEMLKAICVASANDCSVAMAEYLAGSESSFVSLMNNRANELGMTNTTFKNCHGLDEDGHITSSYDISLMSQELLKNHPTITNYTTIWMDSLRNEKSELINTNKLIKSYNGITGLKTGSTGLALYNLSASATRDNLSLIAVIMKAPSTKIRFSEAQKLLDYGFNNFSYEEFAKKDEIIKEINITKGLKQSVPVIFEDNSEVLLEKGQKDKITQVLSLPDIVQAPIQKGDKIGEVSYILDDKTILTSNLVAGESIDKLNLFTIFKKVIYSWIDLLRS